MTMDGNGYQFLTRVLEEWGVTLFAGVTGGGVINFLKYIEPMDESAVIRQGFFTIAEYSAGFVPLGYYLASGSISASVATTGAATKLIGCGLSDAKLHDIPSLYIVPLSGKNTEGFSPLQDTSVYGSNMLVQLRAELPDSVFVLDDINTLAQQLSVAHQRLLQSRPVALVLSHDALSQAVNRSRLQLASSTPVDTNPFISAFRKAVESKRVVVLVGEEMARYQHARDLTTRLGREFKAALIWSINGANAIARDNAYGYGYISFGGNCEAIRLYESLGDDDVLLVLGACPDEYTVNFQSFGASHTFYLSNIPDAYGQINGGLQHCSAGASHSMCGPLDQLLEDLLAAHRELPFKSVAAAPAPVNLNRRDGSRPRPGFVDMKELYQRLDSWWPENSIGFDDVCLAYKDRQFIIQRPNNNIAFYSFYRGSAMGGAFGAAVGAKLASPERSVFLFTGDGCFRLFSGALAEASSLGLVIFVLNNESFGIVEQGLGEILSDVAPERYHANVKTLDYCGVARACQWDTEILAPDLSNLNKLLDRINARLPRSLLIEVPCDVMQQLGSNPRVKNL